MGRMAVFGVYSAYAGSHHRYALKLAGWRFETVAFEYYGKGIKEYENIGRESTVCGD